MDMTNSTKHAMTKLRAITGKLMNKSWHAFIHGGFDFGVIVWVSFFTKSIDVALERSTTTTIARGRALPESSRRGATRSRARHKSTLGTTFCTSQVVAQSNGKITGRHLAAGSGVKLVHASSGNKVGRVSTVLHEGDQHGRRIEVLGAIHVNRTKSNGCGEFGMKIEIRLTRLLFRPVLAKSNGISHEGRVRVM
jgi:hypothetical protein